MSKDAVLILTWVVPIWPATLVLMYGISKYLECRRWERWLNKGRE